MAQVHTQDCKTNNVEADAAVTLGDFSGEEVGLVQIASRYLGT